MFFNKKTNPYNLLVNGWKIEVSYKPIQHLYLRISARDFKIRISAPERASRKDIQRFIHQKSGWIEKKLNALKSRKSELPLHYTNGEKVPLWGQNLILQVNADCKKDRAYQYINLLRLDLRAVSDSTKRQKVVEAFYRTELKRRIPKLIGKWEQRMGVKVADFGVKKMKTRWGTCNINDRRIWLNLHLAKFKPEVLELVVVHEMVHLLERHHNKKFYAFMDRFMPDWKERSKELDGRVC